MEALCFSVDWYDETDGDSEISSRPEFTYAYRYGFLARRNRAIDNVPILKDFRMKRSGIADLFHIEYRVLSPAAENPNGD